LALNVEPEGDGASVQTTLYDDLGTPLGDRRIEVRIVDVSGDSTSRLVGPTDGRGVLRASFSHLPSRYRAIARWEGDADHDGAESERDFDPARAPVQLATSDEILRLDLERTERAVSVQASCEAGAAGLPLNVRDELGRIVASGTTDREGRARLAWSGQPAEEPGVGRLLVIFEGDQTRAGARLELSVLRYRRTRLELQLESGTVADGDPILVSGRLFDAAGPMPRRAVGLFVDGQHAETVLSDDQGRFARALPTPPGSMVEVHASFASDAPWRTSARSRSLRATRATPILWPWLLVPTAICGLLLFGLLRRRPQNARPSVSAPAAEESPGVELAPTLASLASSREVSGLVLDAEHGAPLPGAEIRLLGPGDAVVAVEPDERGAFCARDLIDGGWRMQISAAGYESASLSVTIPHRGQWSGLRARLRTLRAAALAHYTPTARALAPRGAWWALWTPRELAARAPVAMTEAVDGLTLDVERAAYAGPPPSDSDVRSIEVRAEEIAGRITTPSS
jgi:hypothetical protein